MLITIKELIQRFKITITGILHIGAHECEEMNSYLEHNITNVYWVEAMQNKVDMMKSRGIVNIYQGVIDEEDGKEISFHITNNGQSSSILEFGTHSTSHPQVHVTEVQQLVTTRADTLIVNNNIPISTINFLNLDIQGVELRAIKSMEQYLSHIDHIYTEVNTEQVYKDCNLMQELDEYLHQFGFKRIAQKIYTQFGWGDAFYSKCV